MKNLCTFFNILGKADSLVGKYSNILLILKRSLVRNIDDRIKYDLKKDTDKWCLRKWRYKKAREVLDKSCRIIEVKMSLKIFNLIFWAVMIFFLGGIKFMFVMDPEVTSDEFLIYFYGSAFIISGILMLGWYFIYKLLKK